MKKEKDKVQELKEKIVEQGYQTEALEDEIDNLEEELSITKEKLWEIIQENDRLTLTYEPYSPPGHEDENIGYYDQKEEIQRLRTMIRELQTEAHQLNKRLKETPTPKKKYPKAGCVSFDFWPLSDWFRLSLNRWNPGMASQLCIGPIRVDWFAS